MVISDSKTALVASVLKDCGNYIEELSIESDNYEENTFLENLLADIDRSINILTGKE